MKPKPQICSRAGRDPAHGNALPGCKLCAPCQAKARAYRVNGREAQAAREEGAKATPVWQLALAERAAQATRSTPSGAAS